MRLVQDRRGADISRDYKPLLLLQDALAQAAGAAGTGVPWLPPTLAAPRVPVALDGPLDGVDEAGQPFISPTARTAVHNRNLATRPRDY